MIKTRTFFKRVSTKKNLIKIKSIYKFNKMLQRKLFNTFKNHPIFNPKTPIGTLK